MILLIEEMLLVVMNRGSLKCNTRLLIFCMWWRMNCLSFENYESGIGSAQLCIVTSCQSIEFLNFI